MGTLLKTDSAFCRPPTQKLVTGTLTKNLLNYIHKNDILIVSNNQLFKYAYVFYGVLYFLFKCEKTEQKHKIVK